MTEADHISPSGEDTDVQHSEPITCIISRKIRCSIKVKLLIALLALSIVPLVACTTIVSYIMNDMRKHVEVALLDTSHTNFVRLAQDQAGITDGMLDKIKTETRVIEHAAMNLSYRASSGRGALVVGKSIRADQKLVRNMDDMFGLVWRADPIISAVYFCTKNGVCRQYFSASGGRESAVLETEVMPVSRLEQRPWYRNALHQKHSVWSKYANRWRGKQLFSLDPSVVGKIGSKASAALVKALAAKQIGVVAGSPVTVSSPGEWQLKDQNGKHYTVRSENGRLNVYSVSVLTCSHAVTGPDGKPVGVVGIDISMEAISQKIIHTPNEIPGYAFLLNEDGELIEQEIAKMFVPGVGSQIRQKMMAGRTGTDFDPQSASWVAYAPITSTRSGGENSSWSLGISMPEKDIVGPANDMKHTMMGVLQALTIAFIVLTVIVIIAAFLVAKCITRPILALDKGVARIGNGELNYRLNVHTGDEVEMLANSFNKMTDDLKSYIRSLKETTAVKERFESELRVAQEIQMSFLKKIFPPFPNRDDVSLYAMIDPAKEVAGDLFDFGFLDDDHIVFYVGDVSDKGTPAALIMAMTITLMKRAYHQAGTTPAKILQEVNNALAEDNENAMFVTLFIGILDVKSGELIFSNAGHNPPLILSADGTCRYLDLPDGMVLGVIPDTDYEDDRVHLNPGDMIVTYTDGVTEAMNPAHELYSEERLLAAVAAEAGHSVDETVAAILDSVKTHVDGAPQSDDITILALKRSVQP